MRIKGKTRDQLAVIADRMRRQGRRDRKLAHVVGKIRHMDANKDVCGERSESREWSG